MGDNGPVRALGSNNTPLVQLNCPDTALCWLWTSGFCYADDKHVGNGLMLGLWLALAPKQRN